MRTLLVVAGTRPELIKLAPVIEQLRNCKAIRLKTCFSGQHVEILESVLSDFDVQPDVDLRGVSSCRSLSQNLARLIQDLDATMEEIKPDGVVVQGDTTTALAASLVAFQRQVALFHVEAGLRTSDPALPFPEEMNRRLITNMATLHFAPTERARENLLAEGVERATIQVTGNTGIDALRMFLGRPATKVAPTDTRRVLITLHRRENLHHVASVAQAVRRLALGRADLQFLWILHRNGTRQAVLRELSHHPSVQLLEPLGYHAFVHLMASCTVILTDSGGVQEEAPYLGKPVLVLRNETERPEAVESGSARVVGCDPTRIVSECARLLDDPQAYLLMSRASSPFGDGHASERIVRALLEHWELGKGTQTSERSLIGRNGVAGVGAEAPEEAAIV